MNTRSQLVCLWSGFAFVIIYGIGWAQMADFLFPVPGPGMSSAEVVALFTDHGDIIRLGMFLCISSSVLYVPWSVSIWDQLRRVEVGAPVWSYVALLAGVTNFILFALPAGLWTIAAFSVEYRPELGAAIIQLVNDSAWLMFVLMYSPAMLQILAIGIVGMLDKSDAPLMPRWVAYYHLWTALSFVPAGVVGFFIKGPFAWNGIFPIYLPLTTYGIWFFLLAPLLHKAIVRQAGDRH